MSIPKEIAEKLILQNATIVNHELSELARAYLELENKYRMLNNAIAIASWNVNDYVKQFAKDIIDHAKTDSEITKMKEEIQWRKEAYDKLDNINIKLNEDLKMCRKIGVEMQREVNRKLSVENEKLKEDIDALVERNKISVGTAKISINEFISEITKLKEENEKLKKSREVLREACEFYGNWVNSPDGILHRSDCETFFVHEPLEKDKNGIIVAGKKAREAIKADDEIMECVCGEINARNCPLHQNEGEK